MTTEQTDTAAIAVQEPSSPSADAAPDAQAPSESDVKIAGLEAALAKSENDRRSQEGRVLSAARRDADIAALTARQDGSDQKSLLLAQAQESGDFSGLPAAYQKIDAEVQQNTASAAAQTEAVQLQDYMAGLEEDNYKDVRLRFDRIWDTPKATISQLREVVADAKNIEGRLDERGGVEARIKKEREDAVTEYKKTRHEEDIPLQLTPPEGSGTPPGNYLTRRTALMDKPTWSDADIKAAQEL